jgi:uncharacterized membrane protein
MFFMKGLLHIMWKRSELKARAKAVLSRGYWRGFAVSSLYIVIIIAVVTVLSMVMSVMLLPELLSGGNATASFSSGGSAFSFYPSLTRINSPAYAVYYILYGIALIFLIFPLLVGVDAFYLELRGTPSIQSIGTMFRSFSGGRYKRTVGSMLWMEIFVLLFTVPMLICEFGLMYIRNYHMPWMLSTFLTLFFSLLTIPCAVLLIYKSISYSMTSFILADNPKIGARRALRLSIAMTEKQAGRIFKLYLSFIGWVLLGMLCLGIGIIFVMPYVTSTFAELYAKLRDDALNDGRCTYAELNFAPPAPPRFM